MNVNPPDAKDIFLTALEKESPDERNCYLDAACGDNVGLRERLDWLLRAHERAGGFLGGDESVAATLEQPTLQFLEPWPTEVVCLAAVRVTRQPMQ